ncbi:sensor domain-containing diguanylate cyclase [Aestuariibacter salexigens]|uniref:sensor domain-containing diguanylate cyclase n=1 Tax=Aestuariibacter salexigens TaxID=226010 RepID=UPI000400EB93|nr:sensor domain-containing diguanylate cyclase [Aestuariibacter salexigens]
MLKALVGKNTQSLLILILLSVLAVFAVTGYIAINNIVSEQSRIQQQAISPVYSLVNRELLKPLHIAETFAETITFDQLLDSDEVDEAFILEQLSRMEQRLKLTFFVALEKQRKQLMSNGRQFDLIEGKVYWYFEALKTEKKILADLGQVGDVHLFFDVKIYNDDGEFLGFVGVGKRIKSFVESFASYKKQYGYDFLFVNELDQVILSSLPDLIVTDEYIPDLNSLPWFTDSNVNLQDLDSIIVELNDEDVLISEISIPQLNWRLLLLTPLERRQAKLTHTFAINAGLASSAIIVVITVLFFSFIGYKRYLEKRMEVDALTGLANRNYLQRRYHQLKHRTSSVCIVMVDLDHFKKINDTYGHNAGDAVLREAAHILTSMLRTDDTVCRWGGEEFVLMIHNLPADKCLSLINRAREHIAAHPVIFEDDTIQFTASFGVSVGTPDEQFSKHLANADVALYESKKNGRNQATVYEA